MAIRGVIRRLSGGDPAKAIGATNKTTTITIVLFTIAPHCSCEDQGGPCQSQKGLWRNGSNVRVNVRLRESVLVTVCDGEVSLCDRTALRSEERRVGKEGRARW